MSNQHDGVTVGPYIAIVRDEPKRFMEGLSDDHAIERGTVQGRQCRDSGCDSGCVLGCHWQHLVASGPEIPQSVRS